MNKMFEKISGWFTNAFDWLNNGRALMIALVVISAALLLEVLFLIIAKIKGKKQCCDVANRWNVGRKRIVFFITLVTSAYIFLGTYVLWLPIVLLLAVMLMDMLVSTCTGCSDCKVKQKTSKVKPVKEKAKKEKIVDVTYDEDQDDIIEEVKPVKIKEEQKSELSERIANQRAELEKQAEEQRIEQQRIMEQKRAEEIKKLEDENAIAKEKASEHAKKRVDEVQAAASVIAVQKKNDRLEELAEKIERQRKAAEQRTDKMVEHRDDHYSSEQSRHALKSAEETANKMDELQRRMDALRKTVTTRDVDTKTNVTKSMETHSVTATKSVTELKSEKDRLSYQYNTLQNRLVQIQGGATSNFNEAEVKAALMGLKGAISDIQSKIDSHS
jgi:DNA repair exonuclease SbcCD ATPase subunit